MKFILHIICLIIYPFSFLFPRDPCKWAFGSYRGRFNDNSKYLFIHTAAHHPEIESYWLSISNKTVKDIRSKGLKSYWLLSPKGIYLALRAKVWFVNSYSSDIMFCLSGNAKVINLWHGVGLKRCEFNVNNGPLVDRYVRKTLKEHITHPESYCRPNLLLTVSDFQTEMFSRGFRVPISDCMLLGYPRNAILTMDEDSRSSFINKYEDDSIHNLISKMKQYDEIFIYMPTWRDSQRNIFDQGLNLNKINELMVESNRLFLLKPHSNTIVDKIKLSGYSNIILIDNISDIYPVLPYCNVLITDYSSILYDFILMNDHSVILYLYDYYEYQEIRNFYFPFIENVTGTEAYNFDELVKIIENRNYKPESPKREDILKRFWGNTSVESSCEDIIHRVMDTFKIINNSCCR